MEGQEIIYKHIDIKKYNFMREILKKTTSQYGINFLDLNEYFSHDKFNEEWLFLSRFHFNDKGNKYLSDYLLSKLIS